MNISLGQVKDKLVLINQFLNWNNVFKGYQWRTL